MFDVEEESKTTRAWIAKEHSVELGHAIRSVRSNWRPGRAGRPAQATFGLARLGDRLREGATSKSGLVLRNPYRERLALEVATSLNARDLRSALASANQVGVRAHGVPLGSSTREEE